MAWIVDYPMVLDGMHRTGFRCLYYNSGAFGFAPGTEAVRTVAWAIGEDPTIREEARKLVRQVEPADEAELARLATRVWQEQLGGGRVWVMPKSHWAYEMDFGSREWMGALIEHIGLDPGLLAERNNGSAIEFSSDEAAQFRHVVHRLLEMLSGSDFMIAWPGRPVVCTVHHHKQLWWSTTDAELAGVLEGVGIAR
jgi:hypothetical protein